VFTHSHPIIPSRSLTRRGLRHLLACTVVGLCAATAALAQTRYTVTDIGTLPGTDASLPEAINDNGDIAGHCAGSTSSLGIVGFVWRGGVMTSIGGLPLGHFSEAHSINLSGQAVGEGDTGGQYRPQGILYRNNTLLNINPDGGSNIRAIKITDKGVIVGDYAKGLSGNTSSWSPVIWTEDTSQPGRFRSVFLQPYPGGDSKARMGYANAANNFSQVVGYVQNSLFGQYGAFWDNDANHTVALLLPLSGEWNSYAYGVNDSGVAVGESDLGSLRATPVMWSAGSAHTPTALPLPAGDTDGRATAINNLGQILGVTWSNPNSPHFVLWSSSSGPVIDLQAALDAGTGGGWVLGEAAAINNYGRIAGTCLHNGATRGVLLTPF
jgi:uncharacterized membrane protein